RWFGSQCGKRSRSVERFSDRRCHVPLLIVWRVWFLWPLARSQDGTNQPAIALGAQTHHPVLAHAGHQLLFVGSARVFCSPFADSCSSRDFPCADLVAGGILLVGGSGLVHLDMAAVAGLPTAGRPKAGNKTPDSTVIQHLGSSGNDRASLYSLHGCFFRLFLGRRVVMQFHSRSGGAENYF